MFRQSLNRAVLRIRIETVTPLLIRAGDSGLDPTGADLTCVRTKHARYDRTVYVPGSSLKGVVRSAAEAAVRGRKLGGVEGACDPLGPATCARETRRLESHEVHRKHCLACRLFGSTAIKGRASVRDLFPWPEPRPGEAADDAKNRELAARANQVELRNGVAINRVSGAVQHGPFDMEMVPAGVAFWGDVALENYQAWQLGLVAAAFDELTSGFAQLGSTKSRGLGVVRPVIESVLHEQAGVDAPRPLGVGRLVGAPDVDRYGLLPEHDLPTSTAEPWGLSTRFRTTGDAAEAWLEAGRAALRALAREGTKP